MSRVRRIFVTCDLSLTPECWAPRRSGRVFSHCDESEHEFVSRLREQGWYISDERDVCPGCRFPRQVL